MKKSILIISIVSIIIFAVNSFAGAGGAFIQNINVNESSSRLDITLGYRLPNNCYEIADVKKESKIDNNGIHYRLVPETKVNGGNCIDNFKVPSFIMPNLSTTIQLYTFTIKNPEEGPYTIIAYGTNGELVKKFVYVKSAIANSSTSEDNY